jgi:hypothetical protein
MAVPGGQQSELQVYLDRRDVDDESGVRIGAGLLMRHADREALVAASTSALDWSPFEAQG